MSCRRYLAAVAAVTLTLISLLGPARASANQVLAVESEGFRADAGHGLIIWSSYDRTLHRYRLKMYRAGRAARLPVAPSPSIFDASVGTDAHNRPAIVYARCANPGHTPVSDDPGYYVAAPRVTSTSLTRAPVLTGRYPAPATPRSQTYISE